MAVSVVVQFPIAHCFLAGLECIFCYIFRVEFLNELLEFLALIAWSDCFKISDCTDLFFHLFLHKPVRILFSHAELLPISIFGQIIFVSELSHVQLDYNEAIEWVSVLECIDYILDSFTIFGEQDLEGMFTWFHQVKLEDCSCLWL